MTLEVTDSNIDGVLKTNIVVLDFWAQWCGPCRVVGPIIDELTLDNKSDENVAIGKVNVDKNPELATSYGVKSIPVVIYFKDGKEVDRLIGLKSKTVYQDKINSLK